MAESALAALAAVRRLPAALRKGEAAVEVSPVLAAPVAASMLAAALFNAGCAVSTSMQAAVDGGEPFLFTAVVTIIAKKITIPMTTTAAA